MDRSRVTAGRPSQLLLDRHRSIHLEAVLRLTLGCLLASELGLELRRVGSGRRLTFADGEPLLSAWMGRHARVCWMPHARPWELEQVLVARLDLPLNLHGNNQHPFYPNLRAIRAAAKATARALPVWTPAASRLAGTGPDRRHRGQRDPQG